MKKLTALITCTAFLCTSTLRAEDAPADVSLAVTESQSAIPQDRTQVGEAAEEGSKSGRNWAQYAIAGVAIAVAIVALVLVAKNKGTSTSSSSSH